MLHFPPIIIYFSPIIAVFLKKIPDFPLLGKTIIFREGEGVIFQENKHPLMNLMRRSYSFR